MTETIWTMMYRHKDSHAVCLAFRINKDAWTAAANLMLHMLDGHGEDAQHKIIAAIEADDYALALSLWNEGLDAWNTREIAVSATEIDAGIVLDREQLNQIKLRLAKLHRPC